MRKLFAGLVLGLPLVALMSAPIAACAQTSDSTAGVATALKQRTDLTPAAPFVQQSRPAGGLNYIPANAPRAEPAGQALNRDQIKALEAELDTARAHHDRLARRTTAKQPLRSAAGVPYVATKTKQPAKCVLTCETK